MTEFVFNFEAPQSTNTQRDPNAKKIDWDARTKYLVENCGTADKAETEIFIISGVVDLGLQKQEDGKMEWKGTPEQKAEIEAKAAAGESQEYFRVMDNGKGHMLEYKCWPSKPQRTVAITADNPNRMLNQAQFFSEDGGEDAPLRMLLNNEFYQKPIGKVVNKMGYSLKETNTDGVWSLKNNTILYKIADATGQLDENKRFKPGMLGKIIGKPVLCEFQVSSNKVGDKTYLNEKISFRGAVPSMMKAMIPTLDSKYMYVVNFKGPQNPEVLKNLRQSVITTMQQALDFEGSDIQKALIEIGRIQEPSSASNNQSEQPINQAPSVKQESKPQAHPTPQVPDFDDSDIPF